MLPGVTALSDRRSNPGTTSVNIRSPPTVCSTRATTAKPGGAGSTRHSALRQRRIQSALCDASWSSAAVQDAARRACSARALPDRDSRRVQGRRQLRAGRRSDVRRRQCPAQHSLPGPALPGDARRQTRGGRRCALAVARAPQQHAAAIAAAGRGRISRHGVATGSVETALLI